MPTEQIDWNDPSARARLVADVGPTRFNELAEAHRAASTLETVNGHRLRRVSTRFGDLVAVGDTGSAYATIEQARGAARSVPPGPHGKHG